MSKSDIKAIIEVVPDNWMGIAPSFQFLLSFFKILIEDRSVIKNGTTFKYYHEELKKCNTKELLISLAVKPTKT